MKGQHHLFIFWPSSHVSSRVALYLSNVVYLFSWHLKVLNWNRKELGYVKYHVTCHYTPFVKLAQRSLSLDQETHTAAKVCVLVCSPMQWSFSQVEVAPRNLQCGLWLLAYKGFMTQSWHLIRDLDLLLVSQNMYFSKKCNLNLFISYINLFILFM